MYSSNTPYRPSTSPYRKAEVPQTPLYDHQPMNKETSSMEETSDNNSELESDLLDDENSEVKEVEVMSDTDTEAYQENSLDLNQDEIEEVNEEELDQDDSCEYPQESDEEYDEDYEINKENKELEEREQDEEENSELHEKVEDHDEDNEYSSSMPELFEEYPPENFNGEAIIFSELPFSKLKNLVNVISNQIPEINENLVIYKSGTNVNVDLTDDNFISYELLPDNHQFSFKGKSVYLAVLKALISTVKAENLQLNELEKFINYTTQNKELDEKVTELTTKEYLKQINAKLDELLTRNS